MDIDDILADLDHEHVPQESQDLQSLTRSWVAEPVAPELLPWPEELMDRVLARIAKQVCHNRRKRIVAPKLTLEVLLDRSHRRPNWFHGPKNQFQTHHSSDGIRTIQIFGEIVSEG